MKTSYALVGDLVTGVTKYGSCGDFTLGSVHGLFSFTGLRIWFIRVSPSPVSPALTPLPCFDWVLDEPLSLNTLFLVAVFKPHQFRSLRCCTRYPSFTFRYPVILYSLFLLEYRELLRIYGLSLAIRIVGGGFSPATNNSFRMLVNLRYYFPGLSSAIIMSLSPVSTSRHWTLLSVVNIILIYVISSAVCSLLPDLIRFDLPTTLTVSSHCLYLHSPRAARLEAVLVSQW